MECKVVVVYLDHYGHQCRRITSKKFAHLQFGKDEQHVPTIIVKFENVCLTLFQYLLLTIHDGF